MRVLRSVGYPEFHMELRVRGSHYEVAKVDHRDRPEQRVTISKEAARSIIAIPDDYDALRRMMAEMEIESAKG